ncbi:MAG TPA: homocysteine S-methyltransferase family protein [Thermoanaerobaculia bacterium]|nr:homocysteine S-methyltransferase family protein [Thermoanaerobaculia bacterium]
MSFRDQLASPGVIIGDGGLGALLGERGLPPGTPPERWTLDHPDVVADIARAYADAGAELVTTNTFGGSPMRLAHYKLSDRFEEINRRGVEIVREAVADRAFVSASVGPTGRLLAPLGDADPDEVVRGYEQQARVLVDAGADVVIIETMTDLNEAMLAVRGVRAVSDIPIIATMTFDLTPRGPYTTMGISVERAASELPAAGADVVGANCGAAVDEMITVAKAFAACAKVPVAIQPNAGLPRREHRKLVYPETPESFARAIAPLADIGIRILGGCCGTTPEHIAALRKELIERRLP